MTGLTTPRSPAAPASEATGQNLGDADQNLGAAAATGAARSRATKRNRRMAMIAVALWAAVLVGFAARTTTGAMFETLRHARPAPLLLAVVLSGLSIANRGGLYRSTHRAVGINVDAGTMIRLAAAGYAMNKAVKTAGAAPLALFVRHGQHRGDAPGAVTAAYLLGGFGAQLGLAVVILAACVSAALTHTWNSVWAAAAIGVAVYGAVVVVMLVVGLRSRSLLHRIGRGALRFLRWVSRGRFVPEVAGDTSLPAIDDFFDAITLVRHHPQSLVPAVGHAVFDKVLGAAVLWCALLATGVSAPIDTVMTAYAVALVAASMSIVSGGLGTVEASMGALLAARGFEPGVAAAGIVLFRLVDMWIPLLAGTLAGRPLVQALADGEAEPTTAALITAEPTTAALITAEPTTAAPTTAEPTTAEVGAPESNRPATLEEALPATTWSDADGFWSARNDELRNDAGLARHRLVHRASIRDLE